MTDAELITDEIVQKAFNVYWNTQKNNANECMRDALIAVQDDIVRPYKRDAMVYEKAMREIRKLAMEQGAFTGASYQCIAKVADHAIKGEYHEPIEGLKE
jgi:hypothetical protein